MKWRRQAIQLRWGAGDEWEANDQWEDDTKLNSQDDKSSSMR